MTGVRVPSVCSITNAILHGSDSLACPAGHTLGNLTFSLRPINVVPVSISVNTRGAGDRALSECKAQFFYSKNNILTLLGCRVRGSVRTSPGDCSFHKRECYSHTKGTGRDERRAGMLLEFDADQRLWQDTVRDVVAKQCPPSLVRAVAEDGADSAPLW